LEVHLSRESLLRHLCGRDRAVLLGMGLAPIPVPLLLGCSLAVRRTRGMALFACCYWGYDWAISAHLNAVYLRGALPWRWSWLVPLLKVVFPSSSSRHCSCHSASSGAAT
jgi:hypothetical protein